MECNKEEAIRARGIAEDKMQKKDFVAARKIALKAQQLFADLDNISQLLTVCEVHCSAAVKVNGETDWYGILKVEPTAEESLIKKQYRKLALSLHPDKNKFPGAEAAFKLIGEAYMTLSDKGKRSQHDLKRSSRLAVPPRQSSQQTSRTSYVKKQPAYANSVQNTTTGRSNGLNQQQPTTSGLQTFWTVCPYCGMRYQYYKSILNRALRCQNCLKPYVAYDLNAQAAASGANTAQSGIPQEFSGQHTHNNLGQRSNFGIPTPNTGFQGNVGRTSASDPRPKSKINDASGRSMNNGKDCYTRAGNTGNEVRFEKVELEEVKKRERVVKPAVGNSSHKRSRKMAVESSDSESTDDDTESSDIEEVKCTSGQNTGATSRYPRRSSRQKQNVKYNEEESDDADDDDAGDDDDAAADDDYDAASSFVKSPDLKRLKKSGTSGDANQSGKTYYEGRDNVVGGQSSGIGTTVADKDANKQNTTLPHDKFQNGNELNGDHMDTETDGAEEKEGMLKAGSRSTVDLSSEPSPYLGSFSYPDPEFYDFDKDRGTDKFSVDQMWAIYDDLDGMPRYYARIRSVDTKNFKLCYTWLEHVPFGESELAWSCENLPVSCGNFRLGKSDSTDDRMIFSHLIFCEKGTKRNTYKVHPRKGEVWALFKGWDIGWSSYADNHRTYQYEVVEVLSDYVEGHDINVIHLFKVKGFVSLFMQAPGSRTGMLKIPHYEILRFSHKVPCYRMTGNEREGIPEGLLELDSASLPNDFGHTAPSISLETATLGVKQPVTKCVSDHAENVAACSAGLNGKGMQGQANTSTDHHAEHVNGVDTVGHHWRSSKRDPASEAWIHVGSESMSHKHQVAEETVIDHQGSNVKAAAAAAGQQNVCDTEASSPTCYEYPDSEFHSFEEERSCDKFERGQVWALYSDVDKYPKYYGWISKVEVEKFRVYVTWLECCPQNEVEKQWAEQDLPIGCGRFKFTRDTVDFDSTDTFSHLVNAKPAVRRDQFFIHPIISQVWAVYRNWHNGWTRKDLENCEYDVVEIYRHTGSQLEALLLEKVEGYRAVFKPARKDGTWHKMEVLANEYARFSHRIPAFKLTQERGGKLGGFWELDPASVPDVLLFPS
ncbi:uncharacterized protein LOC120283912 [Dioscorea cayenensis subsp. rotundata]|uniref:Uncharacterized protein LOC120283912 n=1 Tax=Dioscorea cayennensis subsp. rotundata TaxID=55577 RepID=A0AB40D353_DIOCR|nr:uncharacterized protein LOC120283912 [Dioscorea cayenensis subsp. rotundata]XP_039146648.1 uncharacterized protein LOC120283912 [Dioscorea cayenensis subsp. rotundata]